jgi:hypothetical protein
MYRQICAAYASLTAGEVRRTDRSHLHQSWRAIALMTANGHDMAEEEVEVEEALVEFVGSSVTTVDSWSCWKDVNGVRGTAFPMRWIWLLVTTEA